MNERIKELAEQAEKYADENFRGEPTFSEAFESKFAELIVLECAQVILDKMKEYPDTEEFYDWINGMDQAQAEIVVHFGVE